MNPELVTYIETARAHGLRDSQIKSALINGGWGKHIVENHLLQTAQSRQALQQQDP